MKSEWLCTLFLHTSPSTSLQGLVAKEYKYPLKCCRTVEYTHLKQVKTAVFSVKEFTYLGEFFSLVYSPLGGIYTT